MNPTSYFRQLLGGVLSGKRRLIRRSYLMPSTHLGRGVMVDVYRPTVPPWRLVNLVIFNDGQDLPRMNFKAQLKEALEEDTLPPTIVVGIHAGDRMREYGTAKRKDYQGRGDRAAEHAKFIIEELVPWLEDRYNIHHSPARRAIAGFSLGGLHAFDVAWRNAKEFGVVGVFSGALWWRSKAFRPDAPDADRIVHDYVAKAEKAPKLRCWFMAGTEDETSDRNNNGVIDAIDDTLHLMDLLRQKGWGDPADMTYVEVEGGRHDPETWGRVVLDFLRWAVDQHSVSSQLHLGGTPRGVDASEEN